MNGLEMSEIATKGQFDEAALLAGLSTIRITNAQSLTADTVHTGETGFQPRQDLPVIFMQPPSSARNRRSSHEIRHNQMLHARPALSRLHWTPSSSIAMTNQLGAYANDLAGSNRTV